MRGERLSGWVGNAYLDGLVAEWASVWARVIASRTDATPRRVRRQSLGNDQNGLPHAGGGRRRFPPVRREPRDARRTVPPTAGERHDA